MANDMSTSEGTVQFDVDGEKCRTWYKLVGDLSSRKHRPLVVLHGGPGLSHDYMLSLSQLAHASIPVIFYDQIGNGRSTRLSWKAPSFWTIDLFVDELENLLVHLGVQDDFDLLGHSWGGILALETVLRRVPAGLKHLVLANSPASWELRCTSRAQLLAALPPDVQDGLHAEGADPARFRHALDVYDALHMVNVKPMPAEWTRSMDFTYGEDGDTTVRTSMFSGPLQDWTSIDRLDRVHVPTFMINGRDDIVQDFVCEPFFRLIPKVKWVTFQQSTHCPHMEEREKFMKLVGDFLRM